MRLACIPSKAIICLQTVIMAIEPEMLSVILIIKSVPSKSQNLTCWW